MVGKILFSERVNEHNFYSIKKLKMNGIIFKIIFVNFYKFWDLIIFQRK